MHAPRLMPSGTLLTFGDVFLAGAMLVSGSLYLCNPDSLRNDKQSSLQQSVMQDKPSFCLDVGHNFATHASTQPWSGPFSTSASLEMLRPRHRGDFNRRSRWGPFGQIHEDALHRSIFSLHFSFFASSEKYHEISI